MQRLKAELRREGIELLVEFYPWKRAQKLAGTKKYIGYFPAWPEEVYQGFVASPAIAWSQVGVVTNSSDDITFTSIDGLFAKHTVGLVNTYTYPSQIERAAARYQQNVSRTDNELLLLRKLSANRHDVAITDPLVFEYLAEKHSIEGVRTITNLFEKPLVVALRDAPDNKKAIDLINQLFAAGE